MLDGGQETANQSCLLAGNQIDGAAKDAGKECRGSRIGEEPLGIPALESSVGSSVSADCAGGKMSKGWTDNMNVKSETAACLRYRVPFKRIWQ